MGRAMVTAIKWASLHFLACILIVPAALRASDAGWGLTGLLTLLTKILYFPIMGLALYPRYWFPGDWIYIPIALNSLVWGLVVALTIMITKRLGRNARPDA
jgi:hypothetical protein